MPTMAYESFTASEMTLLHDALEALAVLRSEADSLTIRRHRMLDTGGQLHPTVMAVYVPQSRTVALFNGAFAGAESVMPMPPSECLRGILAASLLEDPQVRSRWCRVLGVSAAQPPVAAVLDARVVATLLEQPDGAALPLAGLGIETAFALAMAFSTSRPRWFKNRCPEAHAFIARLDPSRTVPLQA